MSLFKNLSSTGSFLVEAAKTGTTILLAILFCCINAKSFATVWTTSTPGYVTDLWNWTNGTSSPTTFTAPGDKWVITYPMYMPGPGTWTVGTPGTAPDTVTFDTSVIHSGVRLYIEYGGVEAINIYGDLILNFGGAINILTGPSSINVHGDLIVNGGWIESMGSSNTSNISVYGNFNILGGLVNGDGVHCTMLINIYGNLNITGGALEESGVESTINITTNGHATINDGTILSDGSADTLIMNTYGDFNMTGGSFENHNTLGPVINNIYGNCSFSGSALMKNISGGGSTSTVHLALTGSLGTMTFNNTSTGVWSGTNIYIDTGCIGQLNGNFSTTTGNDTCGLTVNGTLICPAAYVVNGICKFTLNGVATLEVAHAGGINSAIITAGTKTFDYRANYTFNGIVPQVTGTYLPAALTAPDTIKINNNAGVTLTQTTATTGKLIFTGGILNTGPYTMSVPGINTSVAGAGLTSYVNGTLIKTIAGLTSVKYEVGDLD